MGGPAACQSGRHKVWYSDEIPGGQVKIETNGDTIPGGHRVTMTMTLVATEPGK